MLDKVLLFPYYLSLKVRHALYDKGIKKTYKADVPAVSIGNVTVGGTGKTPHAELVLNILRESGICKEGEIALLSRGYKRKSRGFQQVGIGSGARFAGDEPAQIKHKFPWATVAVDSDRVRGCRYLAHPEKLHSGRTARRCLDKFFNPAKVIVLDDAFQYRRLRADFSIVLIDYNRPVHRDSLMPLGRLRDLPGRVKKADAIIVTKCPAYIERWDKVQWLSDMGLDYNPETCMARLPGSGNEIPVFFTLINYRPLETVFKEEGDMRFCYSERAFLLTGIARPEHLRRYLGDHFKILRHFKFPDHHRFSRGDISSILSALKSNPTAAVITTEKDAQRLLCCRHVDQKLRQRLICAPIEAAFLTPEEKDAFTKTMLSRIKRQETSPEEPCSRTE